MNNRAACAFGCLGLASGIAALCYAFTTPPTRQTAADGATQGATAKASCVLVTWRGGQLRPIVQLWIKDPQWPLDYHESIALTNMPFLQARFDSGHVLSYDSRLIEDFRAQMDKCGLKSVSKYGASKFQIDLITHYSYKPRPRLLAPTDSTI
jgi:hypothetical protein